MSNEMTPYVSKSIINGINTNYAKSQDAAKNAIVYAIKTGEYLLKAKAKVPHGEWKNWIESKRSTLTFDSYSTAHRYMKLAKNKALGFIVNDANSQFNLEDINKAIANASDEEIEEAKRIAHVSHNSGQNEWYTPSEYIESARSVMGGIHYDPASSDIANKTVKADCYDTKENSGLGTDWLGAPSIWMNPPYSKGLIEKFSDKLVSHLGEFSQAIVLVNNATETKWFQAMAKHADCICFPSPRIKFIDMVGEPSGSPLQGQVFLYFGQNADGFAKEFDRYGPVYRNVHYRSFV